ncbi:MAG: hypothetical protein EAX95_16100 [Candidatus Thorarchaeota archaeon]|nr:hypothetical protein [Candidatus Thorarchaeota archaeon]
MSLRRGILCPLETCRAYPPEVIAMRWIVNLCPFLHFDNSRTQTYEHNISIASWNVKSILDYLEVDPQHRVCLDQVTLLEGFKKLFPNYLDTLHQYILEGRIEIVGGTYVMPDYVIPDGESIVRQFLYGTNFIRSEFGVDVRSGWAIDSSGHCAQMPQILRLCGIESYFFWKGMPYGARSEFIWKGLDGSHVNAVWLHAGYDASAWLSENTRDAFSNLLKVVEVASEKASSNNVFVPVGGELAPPLPHLADIATQWNKTFPDMKLLIVTPREFIEKTKAVQASLPVVSGALNSGRFSSSRSGGLSSHIKLKQLNRRLETLLYLAELYFGLAGDAARTKELDSAWRILLFNQDHNIIRGTLADEPYLLAERRFSQAISQVDVLLEEAVRNYASKIQNSGIGVSFAVLNPLPWVRDDIARVAIDLSPLGSPFFEVRDPEGNNVPYQISTANTETGSPEILLVAKNMPSLGHRVYTVVPCDKPPEFNTSIRNGRNWVESDDFIVEFDEFSGSITRLFDKRHQFEVLRDSANYLRMESDVGDLYRYSRSALADGNSDLTTLRYAAKLSIEENGPLRVVVQATGEFKDSTRIQRIMLYEGLHRIDLETNMQFNGRNKRIRTEFPLTVLSDNVAVGTQFGAETKHTSVPDPIEWADSNGGLFSALDWVDCSGPSFGVALSTIGLHEFQFHDGLLSVTLLRSVEQLSHGLDDEPMEAITAREKGDHTFNLSLCPHQGSWRDAHSWRAAAEHRVPLVAFPLEQNNGGLPAEASSLAIEGMNLALSCYKTEASDSEITIRLYEVEGESGTTTIVFPFALECVELVDLTEKVIGEVPSSNNAIRLSVDAHSIITLRIRKGQSDD